jgi:hypothetical protein
LDSSANQSGDEDGESEDDVISIEDTYKEVGQYKSQQSPLQSMTVIHEEDLEDSQLVNSNF